MDKLVSLQHIPNLLLIFVTAGCVATGQLLWKFVAQKYLSGETVNLAMLREVIMCPWFLAGCVAYGVGVIFWLIQLGRCPLSVAVAITTGIVFAVTVVADVLIFSSSLSSKRIFGVVIVFFGILIAYE